MADSHQSRLVNQRAWELAAGTDLWLYITCSRKIRFNTRCPEFYWESPATLFINVRWELVIENRTRLYVFSTQLLHHCERIINIHYSEPETPISPALLRDVGINRQRTSLWHNWRGFYTQCIILNHIHISRWNGISVI